MRAAALLLCAALASGCALLQKSEPTVPRYFSPEAGTAAPVATPRTDLTLRLGRVEGSAHLHERIATRLPAGEITYREDLCWTERPEVFLRRSLSRALFQERGIVESLAGRALTLEVELTAFEFVPGPPSLARMTAVLVLRDERTGLLQQTISVEEPVSTPAGGDPAQAMVQALSLALRAGVERTADRIVARLDEQAAHRGN